jgi:hypothetical protein
MSQRIIVSSRSAPTLRTTEIGNSTGLNFGGGGALLTARNNMVQAKRQQRSVLRAGRAAIAGQPMRGRLRAAFLLRSDVWVWHFSEVSPSMSDVRSWGNNGHINGWSRPRR